MVEFSDESIVHVKEALDRGKGVVAFSAHSGVWEAGTARFAYQFPGQTVMITKKISPPWLDQLLAGSRRKSGVGLVDMKGAMKGLITALRNNQIVMLLSDQNRPDGIFVPFFGRPAKTTPLVGMMAWKLDCAVVIVSNYKTERGSEVKVSRPLDFDERPEDRDEGILHYNRVMNEQLEKLILAEPGQYLWTHLRYRSSPESLDSLYDA
jgi:KDO2-lipid IV(A) lauroyltransferase